ncbi:MAG: hypothetical protein K6L73_14080 [Cellvibrionaceae bacterium]
MDSITILPRYRGPDDSGNGGYVAGLLASHIDGPAQVRLQSPPPLEAELAIEERDGSWVMLEDGHAVVTGVPCKPLASPPPPPSLAQAEKARTAYNPQGHPYGTCFVCGPDRDQGDGLQIFAGAVEGTELVACNWRPTRDLLDVMGFIEPEFVWAAMDCPGYFAMKFDGWTQCLLGEISGCIHEDIPGNQDLIVYAWRRGSEGRKHFAGSAIANGDGKIYAQCEQIWIELPNGT